MSKQITEEDNFAIIETGGKQYKVSEGSIISVEKLSTEDKGKISFDKVLLQYNGTDLTLGAPYIPSSTVKAEVINPLQKDKKVTVFKFKNKTGYKKTIGHRQQYTTVKIVDLGSKKSAAKKTEKTKTEA